MPQKDEGNMHVNDEIKEIQARILTAVPALQIYLFDAQAKGTQRRDTPPIKHKTIQA